MFPSFFLIFNNGIIFKRKRVVIYGGDEIALFAELLAIVGILVFSFVLSTVMIPMMRQEMKKFTWDQYFKQCGIYQGISRWTIVKSYLPRIRR